MSSGACSTPIIHSNMKFLLCIKPNPFYVSQYVKDLQSCEAKTLVKACEDQYDLMPFNNAGIKVIELLFPDGQFPSSLIIEDWLEIVDDHFRRYPTSALAVHCRCGLGRSAVLVAIALMESGVQPLKTAQLIRITRRGAFNQLQFDRICQYKANKRLLFNGEDETKRKHRVFF